MSGSAPDSSLVNSSRIRSAVIRLRSPAIRVIAATTSGATVKRSWEANRAARSIRSGSSANESSGVPGVRSRCWARSLSPPCGSVNACPGTETAIALTAKSRRLRSSTRLSPYRTIGLRLTRS